MSEAQLVGEITRTAANVARIERQRNPGPAYPCRDAPPGFACRSTRATGPRPRWRRSTQILRGVAELQQKCPNTMLKREKVVAFLHCRGRARPRHPHPRGRALVL